MMFCMRRLLLCTATLFLVFALAPRINGVFAATLSFDPSSVNVEAGETFDLTIQVDVGTDEALGVDALMEYDSEKLKVNNITNGTFLTVNTKEYGNPGSIYVGAVVESSGESVTGSGPLATITFEAIGSGTSNVTFVCEIDETGESNIPENSPDVPDLLECSQNGEAVVIVEGGDSDDSGTSDGGSSGSSGGSGGSELPKTGIVEDMVILSIIAGGLLFLFGLGTRIYG